MFSGGNFSVDLLITDNIAIQRFCNTGNQYIVRQSYKDTSQHMSNDVCKMTVKR